MRMLIIPAIAGTLAAIAGFITLAIGRRQEKRRQNEPK